MYHMDRQTTPPSAAYALPNHKHYNNSYYSQDSSPESVISNGSFTGTVNTNFTTPPETPPIRHNGPVLLPKIRCQDQAREPSTGPVRTHRRTASTASSSFQHSLYPYNSLQRQAVSRRTTSPERQDLNSPSSGPFSAVSMPSPCDSGFNSGFNSALNSPITFQSSSRRPSLAHNRTTSTASIPVTRHSRSGSNSSIDENTLMRHGYPTQYRQIPQYITAPTVTSASAQIQNVMAPTQQSTTASFDMSGQSFDLDPELAQLDAFLASASQQQQQPTNNTTTLLNYLTSPNPSPALVRRTSAERRDVFWWDIRNLRSWSDFSVDTINSIKNFPSLLTVNIDSSYLPSPPRNTNPAPETEFALQDIYASFFATKLNAALAMSQGQNCMVMQSLKPLNPNGAQNLTPDFLSKYPSDVEQTFGGEARGRVVGLVKTYDCWNTAMRTEGPAQQVKYLKGLAHLHRIMREHGCRYGFVMTEIELLCVRAGGPLEVSNRQPEVPLFGYLETSPPIPLAASAQSAPDAPRDAPLTAALALWYLHMLAKETSLPGQPGWRMDVGGPSLCTRQNALDRDAWMPKIGEKEKRDARRCRAWAMPADPWNRKEAGKKGRGRAKGSGAVQQQSHVQLAVGMGRGAPMVGVGMGFGI